MKFHYDKGVDALYIRFNANRYKESDEVRDGVIIDYDAKGKIIGIEVLDASRQFPNQFKRDLLKRKLPLSLVIESGRA